MSDNALTPMEHARVFDKQIVPKSGLEQKTSFEHPKAVILAGQPGAGKGGLTRAAERELDGNMVTIDPDELRQFHPQVSEFRNAHPYTWSGQTHDDASQWAKELLQASKEGKKNLIFDTTLSDGPWTSDLIKDLQSRGYEVEVRAVAAHKLESEHGVDSRFSQKLDAEGFGRYVPEGARDAIYGKLPDSLDTVHQRTDAAIRIFNREGVELYDSRHDARAPGPVLEAARDTRLQDPIITRNLNAGWQAQRTWHRDLPDTLPHNPKIPANTAKHVLQERAERNVVEGVERNAATAHTIDFSVRVKPAVMGGLRIAGAAATAYDAADTAHTVGQLRAQGNEVGAQSQIMQFGARNVGGWVGGVIGVELGVLAGLELGPGLVATGAVGGALGVMGGSAAVQRFEQRSIYTQTDSKGREWSFDPKAPEHGWSREVVDAFAERGLSAKHNETAPPQVADELNYKASNRAMHLRLATPDVPVEPYRIPADASDKRSLRDAPWERNAQTGQWSREVADGLIDKSMNTYRDPATPEKAAELDAYSHSVIAYNASRSQAVMAARYEDFYAKAGWEQRYGPVPEAVTRARAMTDTLLASDGKAYTRDSEGQWSRERRFGQPVKAEGDVLTELEQTWPLVKAMAQPQALERTLEGQEKFGAKPSELPRPTASSAPPGDLRGQHHPGHQDFQSTLREVQSMEARRGMPSGPHSEQVAAALLGQAEREGIGINRVEMTDDGQVHGLQRINAFETPRSVSVDARQAQSISMEEYSTQWAQARSPHLVSHSPAAGRTPSQAQGIDALSQADQTMFARLRRDVPAHIDDDHVMQAMLNAKQADIGNANKIDRVLIAGDKIWVAGTTPGFRAATDVSQAAPPLQDTVQQIQVVDRQREQQLAVDMQRQQEGPSGRGGPVMG